MAVITHHSIFGAGIGSLQADIRALQVIDGPQGPVILAAGGVNGSLVSLTMEGNGQIAMRDSALYTSAVAASLSGGVSVWQDGDTDVAVVGCEAGEGLVGYQIAPDGALGQAVSITLPGLDAGATGAFAASATGFVYVASGDDALRRYYRDAQGQMQTGGVTLDSAESHLSSTVEVLEAQVSGQSYLLTLCSEGDGVSAFSVDPDNGDLGWRASMGAEAGLGILQVPVAMEVVQAGARSFVIVASAGDEGQGGALSVMELDADGGLRPVDHILDSLETRFARVQDMALVEHQGRHYVVVAGSDDGMSLFTLLPDGRLLHVDTIADGLGFGLSSISAMSAVVSDAAIEILLASQDQPGLSQFRVALHDQGITQEVDAGSLSGTVHDDLLVGGSGNSTLSGGMGEDILLDGFGVDRLIGGEGADVFVLEADTGRDVIVDFQAGSDRIDLTLYPMVYSADQVEITATDWGALMEVRGDVTEIYRAGGGTLSREEVVAALDWETGRAPLVLLDAAGNGGNDELQGDDLIEGTDDGDQIDGRAGNDTLLGGRGEDTLRGGDGNDRIEGGVAHDVLEGMDGNDTLLGGDNADTMAGGAGADLLEGEHGFDSLTGDTGDDTLLGGEHADTLRGGDGQDSLFGDIGHDELHGDLGDDTVEGGANRDTLYGGAGRDFLHGHNGFDWLEGGVGDDTLRGGANADTLFGGDGADRLFGDLGHDLMHGGDGDDRLEGRANRDVLHGDAGDDLLLGQNGFDRLFGGIGDDTLYGGANADTMDGGDGADHLFGEVGHDEMHGGDGNDTLEGGSNRDTLYGDAGDDVLEGQHGFDRLEGGAGDDTLIGGANADTLFGGDGADFLEGSSGFDRLFGQLGDDTLRGGVTADTLFGGEGEDRLFGDEGHDVLHGGGGNDTLDGGANRDVLNGDGGDDLLLGQDGFDQLDGGTGSDTLVGGGADDTLIGGEGADTFVFRDNDNNDRILDFTPGLDELLLDVTETAFGDLTVVNQGSSVQVQWTGGSVILEGVTAWAFDPSDVVFV